MADPQPDIVEQEQILDRAIWRKWNKFIWSGLILIIIGLLIISGGIFLNANPNSIAMLIIGIGAILVIIGIIRLLIGVINPMTHKDLDQINLQQTNEES